LELKLHVRGHLQLVPIRLARLLGVRPVIEEKMRPEGMNEDLRHSGCRKKTFKWRESMKKYSVILGTLIVFALVALFSGIAAADRESVYERIHQQEERIHHGVRSGTLTHGQAVILRDNL
jgi:hypothetical protein